MQVKKFCKCEIWKSRSNCLIIQKLFFGISTEGLPRSVNPDDAARFSLDIGADVTEPTVSEFIIWGKTLLVVVAGGSGVKF